MWHQAGNREVGHVVGDLIGRERTIGAKPLRRPVQGAEKRAGRDGGVGGGERASGDPGRDQRADAALVAVPFGDDDRPPLRGQRVDLEVRRRSFDLRDEAQRVANGELAQTLGERAPIAFGGGQRRQQPVQRSILAEEEDLVLAAEVVIEVRGRQVGGDRDVSHAGGREAAAAEDLRSRAQDVDAAALGADRTTVRKLNHRSILADLEGWRENPGASEPPGGPRLGFRNGEARRGRRQASVSPP